MLCSKWLFSSRLGYWKKRRLKTSSPFAESPCQSLMCRSVPINSLAVGSP
ncbi:MAG TPA: hypothetical protein EYG11_04840 [Candidatus Latescibacteria bacterium]|nr:hypothetical protein [Candidatus Handelsmanbacteria bacterium]HIL08006.1 hypothetical protein [Candidatus Latescibacterota bacterium]